MANPNHQSILFTPARGSYMGYTGRGWVIVEQRFAGKQLLAEDVIDFDFPNYRAALHECDRLNGNA